MLLDKFKESTIICLDHRTKLTVSTPDKYVAHRHLIQNKPIMSKLKLAMCNAWISIIPFFSSVDQKTC